MNHRTFVVRTVTCFASAGGFATPAVAQNVVTVLVGDLHDAWKQGPMEGWFHLDVYRDLQAQIHVGNRLRLIWDKRVLRPLPIQGTSGAYRVGHRLAELASEAVDRVDGVDTVWKSRGRLFRSHGQYVAGTNQRVVA